MLTCRRGPHPPDARRASRGGFLDNIVLAYEDGHPAVIPLPAGLPLLAAGLGALGLMARRRRKAA